MREAVPSGRFPQIGIYTRLSNFTRDYDGRGGRGSAPGALQCRFVTLLRSFGTDMEVKNGHVCTCLPGMAFVYVCMYVCMYVCVRARARAFVFVCLCACQYAKNLKECHPSPPGPRF